jgi:hypothetical protein
MQAEGPRLEEFVSNSFSRIIILFPITSINLSLYSSVDRPDSKREPFFLLPAGRPAHHSRIPLCFGMTRRWVGARLTAGRQYEVSHTDWLAGWLAGLTSPEAGSSYQSSLTGPLGISQVVMNAPAFVAAALPSTRGRERGSPSEGPMAKISPTPNWL